MTSNREWLNGLAASDVSALNAWMDAEHVESANGTSDGARMALDDENDSRGKLEADIEEYLACEYGCIPGIVAVYPDWLDRQAAITRAECERICDTCEWPSLAAQPDQEAYDRIAELTAEREIVTLVDLEGNVIS